ncbi:transposable element Tc1 transposase [Trichonephila clavipes]|nr:transposable element Tc1 transposase [Trichonephila clavipes]
MGRSDAAIIRCWQEWVGSFRLQRQNGSGRPRAIADREERLIVRSAVTDPDSSLSTIRRWNYADWGRMVFSDKSRFRVLTIIEDVPGDVQGSVPILLSLLCATQAFNRKLWSGVPFRLTAGPLWLLLEATYNKVQDNARPHTARARVVINCLTACQTLPLPARSSDLSPIEHVCDMMARLHFSGNANDLAQELEQTWQEIPQETIRGLYPSIARLVTAYIQARVGSIPY